MTTTAPDCLDRLEAMVEKLDHKFDTLTGQ